MSSPRNTTAGSRWVRLILMISKRWPAAMAFAPFPRCCSLRMAKSPNKWLGCAANAISKRAWAKRRPEDWGTMGPWDHGTMGLWDYETIGPWDHRTIGP